MFRKYVLFASWAWMILVGVLLIFLPHGPIICIVCGGAPTLVIGGVTAILGIVGLTVARSNPMPG
jgi:hypothetical protein